MSHSQAVPPSSSAELSSASVWGGAADCLQVAGYCYAPFVPVERNTETRFKVS